MSEGSPINCCRARIHPGDQQRGRQLGWNSPGLGIRMLESGPPWAHMCVTWEHIPSLGFLLLSCKMERFPRSQSGSKLQRFLPQEGSVPQGYLISLTVPADCKEGWAGRWWEPSPWTSPKGSIIPLWLVLVLNCFWFWSYFPRSHIYSG